MEIGELESRILDALLSDAEPLVNLLAMVRGIQGREPIAYSAAEVVAAAQRLERLGAVRSLWFEGHGFRTSARITEQEYASAVSRADEQVRDLGSDPDIRGLWLELTQLGRDVGSDQAQSPDPSSRIEEHPGEGVLIVYAPTSEMAEGLAYSHVENGNLPPIESAESEIEEGVAVPGTSVRNAVRVTYRWPRAFVSMPARKRRLRKARN